MEITIKFLVYMLGATTLGAIIGSIITYVHMNDRAIKSQQKKIITRFVGRMNQRKKNGEIDLIKKSIKSFTKKCLEFSPEIFYDFKVAPFEKIAFALTAYERQSYSYFQDNGMMTMQTFEYVSEEETIEMIHTEFYRLFGI